jgi:predicted RND superfamily exporter protein
MSTSTRVEAGTSTFAARLDRHSRTILIATFIVTLLLAVPTIVLDAPPQASQDPSGEVFDVQDRINEIFESPIHGMGMIAEARNGDILTQAALSELMLNQVRLVSEDEQGGLAVDDLESQPYLFGYFDTESGRQVTGVTSMADAVDDVLRQHPLLSTTLAEASDEQVKFAAHTLLSNPETAGMRDFLSIEATSEPRTVLGQQIDWWESPALLFNVLADNEKLGGGALAINVGGDENAIRKEEFNRRIQEVLRGDQDNYRLWGIAIDVNLESADEGQQAGAFITLTAIIAVGILGLTLRSYWAVAFTGVGLAALIVWLKGISTLVGIKGGLITDMLVPIAMISLGVDFAVHAIRRYQEERQLGYAPRKALTVGMTGVAGALVLAFASDSLAFLSNTAAGIESVVHFGFAASIAVGSAFLVLGLVVPLAVARAEEHTADLNLSRRTGRILKIFGGFGMAAGAGSSIIVMIAMSVPIGLAILGIVSIFQLVIPYWIGTRKARGRDDSTGESASTTKRASTGITERIVGQVVENHYIVIGLTAVVTALAVWMALRLESTFDVKDFFASDSDFVVSLDQIDKHVGDRGGEPASMLIEGDLSDPVVIAALSSVYANLQQNQALARGHDGEVQMFPPDPLKIINSNTNSEFARERVLATGGVEINDADGDGVPDSSDGIRAVLELARVEGVYNSDGELIFNPETVSTAYRRIDGVDYVGLTVSLPGTREQSGIGPAYDQIIKDLSPLDSASGIVSYGVTGSPFTRNEGLKATTSSLQKSIPIAAVAALILLFTVMRSVRFAIVTVIPIGLVVTWLYAIMYVAGIGLNFVTATIGAVSIGVGIDYSIHMTERFREELKRSSSRSMAARQAARGTGVALAASAASSIGGFAVMGFAPMPLFSSYGILTAIMIALALTASVLVLPALLMLTGDDQEQVQVLPGED